MDFNKKVTVTSATPYVNGVKHLGNIIGSMLPADIFHRFLDLFGVENIYICGTDDHGTAVEISAAAEGLAPRDFANKYNAIQKEIYKQWHFDFTHFGFSSSQTHHAMTKTFFEAIYKNGYIKKDFIILPYCTSCKRFLPDRYIIGKCPKCGYDSARGDQCEKCSSLLDPKDLVEPSCSICKNNQIEFKKENHLFLDLSMLEAKLKQWVDQKDWPVSTKQIALGWLKEGLNPRCITRNIDWGVKVPLEGYEHLVFYVWFDACLGYVSMTKDGEVAGKLKDWKKWWTDSTIVHFIGKDNVPFHTIFWPGQIMASHNKDDKFPDLSLPGYVIGYDYLNWGGQKFSTSKGIGLFSDEALHIFPIDYWRYYLSSILPETKDSNFDWDDFAARINNELIANYGNLFYRVTKFIEANFSSRIPDTDKLGPAERLLKENLGKTADKVMGYVENFKLRDALKEVFGLASQVNKYFQDSKPWEQPQSAETAKVMYVCANMLRSISIMLYPYVPVSSKKALDALGAELDWSDIKEFTLKPGTEIKSQILFRKIEATDLDRAKAYQSKYAKISEKGNDNNIPFSDFTKLNLVVGTVVDVSDHPEADKLYVLKVNLGHEQRTIIAGIKHKYKKEELLNRQIIVVENLEPKELRGVRSYGMLLAAEDGTIISPEKHVKNGTRLK
ncbi:MAG: methionine--tRNA ligase [Candidatus Aenigmarchaeota archaeon]|nr:methionine--tRNA ligase [Candidatus Aenigmarchaeota archaeon]